MSRASCRREKWQDKDGDDRYTTEIVANEMKMLGGRASGGDAEHGSAARRARPFNGGSCRDQAVRRQRL